MSDMSIDEDISVSLSSQMLDGALEDTVSDSSIRELSLIERADGDDSSELGSQGPQRKRTKQNGNRFASRLYWDLDSYEAIHIAVMMCVYDYLLCENELKSIPEELEEAEKILDVQVLRNWILNNVDSENDVQLVLNRLFEHFGMNENVVVVCNDSEVIRGEIPRMIIHEGECYYLQYVIRKKDGSVMLDTRPKFGAWYTWDGSQGRHQDDYILQRYQSENAVVSVYVLEQFQTHSPPTEEPEVADENGEESDNGDKSGARNRLRKAQNFMSKGKLKRVTWNERWFLNFVSVHQLPLDQVILQTKTVRTTLNRILRCDKKMLSSTFAGGRVSEYPSLPQRESVFEVIQYNADMYGEACFIVTKLIQLLLVCDCVSGIDYTSKVLNETFIGACFQFVFGSNNWQQKVNVFGDGDAIEQDFVWSRQFLPTLSRPVDKGVLVLFEIRTCAKDIIKSTKTMWKTHMRARLRTNLVMESANWQLPVFFDKEMLLKAVTSSIDVEWDQLLDSGIEQVMNPHAFSILQEYRQCGKGILRDKVRPVRRLETGKFVWLRRGILVQSKLNNGEQLNKGESLFVLFPQSALKSRFVTVNRDTVWTYFFAAARKCPLFMPLQKRYYESTNIDNGKVDWYGALFDIYGIQDLGDIDVQCGSNHQLSSRRFSAQKRARPSSLTLLRRRNDKHKILRKPAIKKIGVSGYQKFGKYVHGEKPLNEWNVGDEIPRLARSIRTNGIEAHVAFDRPTFIEEQSNQVTKKDMLHGDKELLKKRGYSGIQSVLDLTSIQPGIYRSCLPCSETELGQIDAVGVDPGQVDIVGNWSFSVSLTEQLSSFLTIQPPGSYSHTFIEDYRSESLQDFSNETEEKRRNRNSEYFLGIEDMGETSMQRTDQVCAHVSNVKYSYPVFEKELISEPRRLRQFTVKRATDRAMEKMVRNILFSAPIERLRRSVVKGVVKKELKRTLFGDDGLNRKNIVFFGNAEFGFGRTGPVPRKRLLYTLAEKVAVIFVDEFRTSLLCHACHCPTVALPDRQVKCGNEFCCAWNRRINRDINAAINIAYLGFLIMLGLPRPREFSRDVRRP